MIKKILENIGIPKNSINIYLRLLEVGSSSPRLLAENLNIPRPSVYDYLKILLNYDLIIERKDDGKKVFEINDIKNIKQLIRTKIETLESSEQELKKIEPFLKKQTKSLEPKIKFYSGAEGIRNVLKDLLWYKNIETVTMWPISDMIEILGKDYLENLNRKRIKQNISIKGIWPKNKIVKLKDYPFLGVGKKHLRQLRIAPNNMEWDMSYWLYDNKVAFISSKQECFGFIINSKDFANLMRSQFEVIWKISKPIKAQTKHTDDFLKTI